MSMFNKKVSLYTAEQSRAIDELALERLNVSSNVLMQRAAQFSFDVALKYWPNMNSVSVFAGKGNNAGDAFLFARLAQDYGIRVQLFMMTDLSGLNEEAKLAYKKIDLSSVQKELSFSDISGDLIIDGLIGTGLRGAADGPYDEAIRLMNETNIPILSLDIPSGVNASTGAVVNDAVMADITTTFISLKIGLYVGKGRVHSGDIKMDSLGVPNALLSSFPGIELSVFEPAQLPPMAIDSYKNRQGHLLIIGGDEGMPGSILMAAEAALRSGAGLVTVATRAEHMSLLVSRIPEVMVAEADIEDLSKSYSKYDAILIGPGLGRNRWGKTLYEACQSWDVPLVVDADGLFWMAKEGRPVSDTVIVSPHVGEAARLLGVDSSLIEQDRIKWAKEIRDRFGAIGVVKGPGSVVFGHKKISICEHGNPGMATAGMGDVLSGVIAGFVVQKFADFEACLEIAVLLHSAAADEAAKDLGQRSLMATDVIRFLPRVMQGER